MSTTYDPYTPVSIEFVKVNGRWIDPKLCGEIPLEYSNGSNYYYPVEIVMAEKDVMDLLAEVDKELAETKTVLSNMCKTLHQALSRLETLEKQEAQRKAKQRERTRKARAKKKFYKDRGVEKRFIDIELDEE